jgi:trehalose synthase
MVHEVHVDAIRPQRLATIIGADRMSRLERAADAARQALDGRTVFNLNSTAAGGGVAEMLQTLLANARAFGIDTRWLVITGTPEFFAVTKRIHNHLYGSPGDGGPLSTAERAVYEATLAESCSQLLETIRPGDIVLVHDPQPAGLAPALAAAGAIVVWRCHVGIDQHNQWSDRAWEFLRPYLEGVHAFVFTRRSFAPAWIDDDRLEVIRPSIDPFSSKNRDLSVAEVRSVLTHTGLLAGSATAEVMYTRRDGTTGRVDRYADVLQTGPPPSPDTPLVVQVSRWDRMKDMVGVMEAFTAHVDGRSPAHLVLAGPNVSGVSDDPEGADVLDECVRRWRQLPHRERARVHLACLPMRDSDENATIVNALQRHAAVVTQKSLAEGFGLTVGEAMWKARPVVATRVGGIVDQIDDGVHGLLIDDPSDLPAFGRAVRRILESPSLAAKLGRQARERVRADFLGDAHLEQWGQVLGRRLSDDGGRDEHRTR